MATKKEKADNIASKSKKKKVEETFHRHLAKKTLDLMTSGFGLVAALAWNEVVKELIEEYVKPFFGESSGLISLLIYALAVTFLAVLVTYNLSKIAKKK